MTENLTPIFGLRRDAAHGLEKSKRGTRKWERGTVGLAVRSAFRVPRSDFETPRLLRDHVHRPVVLGELAPHPQERLAPDRPAIALVHVGPHDHGHHPRLVPEQHEDEPFCPLGPPARPPQPPALRPPRAAAAGEGPAPHPPP